MFMINDNPEFTHPVKVMTPVDGGHREDEMKVRFRVLSVDEVEGYDLNTPDGTKEFLKAVIVTIEDVVGEDKKPLPYNDALRDQLIGMYNVRAAMSNTYIRAVMKARVGN